jgi:hypothetical protein
METFKVWVNEDLVDTITTKDEPDLTGLTAGQAKEYLIYYYGFNSAIDVTKEKQ